jgi:uncharacterized membrane protein YczE
MTLRLRCVLYLLGCVVFAVGATLFVVAGRGTDPLDVFVLGLREHVPITFGVAQAGIAVLCLGIWAAWNRRRPQLTPLFTFLFCGSLIDGLLYLEVAKGTSVPPPVLVGLAGALCAYGSALIIMSGVGIRAMDLVALTMRERWGWPLWCAKGALEAGLLVTGWVLGGPVGYGTVFFLVAVDLLLQPFMQLTARVFGLPNLGMTARPATTGAAA